MNWFENLYVQVRVRRLGRVSAHLICGEAVRFGYNEVGFQVRTKRFAGDRKQKQYF